MGAKAWFAVSYNTDPRQTLGNAPVLDREASAALAKRIMPDGALKEMEDGDLSFLNPDHGEVFVGVYGDLVIIAHPGLAVDRLSEIDGQWHSLGLGAKTYVHATHSVSDWCAFALWDQGKLVRALSVSPDGGIHEEIGERLPFERPYWDGEHPVEQDVDDDVEDEFDDDVEEEAYPFPFHPLELSEAALLEVLGYQFEGRPDDWVCDPMQIPIMRFGVQKEAWWKFW